MNVDILVTLHIQNHIKMLLIKRCSSLSLQKYDNKKKMNIMLMVLKITINA